MTHGQPRQQAARVCDTLRCRVNFKYCQHEVVNCEGLVLCHPPQWQMPFELESRLHVALNSTRISSELQSKAAMRGFEEVCWCQLSWSTSPQHIQSAYKYQINRSAFHVRPLLHNCELVQLKQQDKIVCAPSCSMFLQMIYEAE